MIVIVTGGRTYDGPGLAEALDELEAEHGPFHLCVGDATGADAIARTWAARAPERLHVFRADWARHGRAAGPIRNEWMVGRAKMLAGRYGGPIICLEAPGGRGTADCVRRCHSALIEVRLVA